MQLVSPWLLDSMVVRAGAFEGAAIRKYGLQDGIPWVFSPACRVLPDKSQARAEVSRAISECLAQCGRSAQDVGGLCVGTAGLDAPEDVALLQQSLKQELPTELDIAVYSDAVIALASGTGGMLHGCVLVAGGYEEAHGHPCMHTCSCALALRSQPGCSSFTMHPATACILKQCAPCFV